MIGRGKRNMPSIKVTAAAAKFTSFKRFAQMTMKVMRRFFLTPWNHHDGDGGGGGGGDV